jgi:UDP-N-acetylmuramate dehydrogenase
MLLEAAGAKKLRKGGARVAESHANFIFNLSQATARDILELSFEMQDLVYREFGVWLHYEMELLGQVGSDLRQRYL